MMILLYSDLHLEFADFLPDPGVVAQADVVVLAGDIEGSSEALFWAAEKFEGKDIIYVHGNHEAYRGDLSDLVKTFRRRALEEELHLSAGGSMHFLERDAVVIQGVRFLGCCLWTDFELHASGPTDTAGIELAMDDAKHGLADYHLIRLGDRLLMPQDTRSIHIESLRWLLEQLASPHDGPTVVVTHHAPSGRSADPRWRGDALSPCFASELPADAFAGADLWLHGHMHSSADYLHHGCRVVCNPRGYVYGRRAAEPENAAFNSACLIQV